MPEQISLFEAAKEESWPGPERSPGTQLAAPTPRPPLPNTSRLRVISLGSGSRGNCLYVESGTGSLLVDAGFSCRQLEKRLVSIGVDPKSVDAILLTHEHGDHSRGAVRFSHRNQSRVFATAGTLASRALAKLPDGTTVRSGVDFEAAGFRIEPFAVPHDASEPVGFTLEDADGFRVGVVADLGARTQLAWAKLRDLSVLVLETNHDLDMLRGGPYPWVLKQRVASRHGHLSNRDAAAGLDELISDRLRAVVLYHLSETNNLPELAYSSVAEALEQAGCEARIVLAGQDQTSDWIDLNVC